MLLLIARFVAFWSLTAAPATTAILVLKVTQLLPGVNLGVRHKGGRFVLSPTTKNLKFTNGLSATDLDSLEDGR